MDKHTQRTPNDYSLAHEHPKLDIGTWLGLIGQEQLEDLFVKSNVRGTQLSKVFYIDAFLNKKKSI